MIPIKELIKNRQRKVWKKKLYKCYWPNSIRYEDIDGDNQKAYRCIYINDELKDVAPLCATEQQAKMRLKELCEVYGVEEEQRIWKEI